MRKNAFSRGVLATCLMASTLTATGAQASAADHRATSQILLQGPDWTEFVRLIREKFHEATDEQRLEGICLDAAALSVSNPSSPYTEAEACLNAAVRGLDRTGGFATREEHERLRNSINEPPKFGSVGLELVRSAITGGLRVVSAIADAPAARAGVTDRDDIIAIDGIVLQHLKIEEAVRLLRGAPGSTVVLKLRRGAQGVELEVPVVRQLVAVRYVKTSVLQREFFYSRIRLFGRDTASQLLRDVNFVAALSPVSPKRFILDLRGCSGGLLQEVIQTAALFLSPGAVVGYTQDRLGEKALTGTETSSELFLATPLALSILRELPLVILVDGRTASGAELLAQSLREQRGARVIGSNTAGDSGVRVWSTLPGGMGVNFTTSRLRSSRRVAWSDQGLALDEARRAAGRIEYGDSDQDALLAGEMAR